MVDGQTEARQTHGWIVSFKLCQSPRECALSILPPAVECHVDAESWAKPFEKFKSRLFRTIDSVAAKEVNVS